MVSQAGRWLNAEESGTVRGSGSSLEGELDSLVSQAGPFVVGELLNGTSSHVARAASGVKQRADAVVEEVCLLLSSMPHVARYSSGDADSI